MAPKRKSAAPAAQGPPMKKAKGPGGRVVDTRVPMSGLTVVDDFTIKLNQTHIDANNNKFYIIQVLQGGGKFYAWNRWGRVGEDGQNKLQNCASKELAVKEFEKKFREKTQNAWANRDSFRPANGKYTIVETEESGGGGGGGADQAPMGKLTEAQIGKGQAALDKLKPALKKGGTPVEELSSLFYTLIPHDFGRRRPPPINTSALLEEKSDLLKFYLRMGFEKVETKAGLSPISGVMSLPLPRSLADACRGICSRGSVQSSTNAGKALSARNAGKPKKQMSDALYGAIHLYTSNAIYQALNQVLRDENRAAIKRYYMYLRLFLEAASCFPLQKRTLWRGISADLFSNPQYEVGKTVTWWGVSSCTSSKAVADGFAGGCGGGCTVVTVEAKTAFDVAPISMFGSEKESILCPGTQLKVIRKARKNGITQIAVQEVGRAID